MYLYIYIIYIYTYIYKYISSWHIFMARSRFSNSRLKEELFLHCYVRFSCVPIYIFDFHHKQYASNWKDFTFVKFTTQLFCGADESLKDETRLLLL